MNTRSFPRWLRLAARSHTFTFPINRRSRGYVECLEGRIAPATFAAGVTFGTDSRPISLAEGDLNGDGRPDLAIANANADTVSVLLNTTAPGATTPSYAAAQSFA